MSHSRLALVLSATLLGGCQGTTESSGSDPNRGSDEFDAPSFSNYTMPTQGGANWLILDGYLIGRGEVSQSLLMRTGVSFADGWVEAQSSSADDGGLIFRFQNANDYYVLAFRDDAAIYPLRVNSLALYHFTGGEFHRFWIFDPEWRRGTTQTIRIEAAGPVLRVILNGVLLDEVVPSPANGDPAPYQGAGRIGVRHNGLDGTWTTRVDRLSWSAAATDR